ncbi:MAG: ABC transporter substrate-binding protein [Ketobacteraceae bacterium]|nr:ABC transporter substrate-binding protein [Ketobacteraceae bacterium]
MSHLHAHLRQYLIMPALMVMLGVLSFNSVAATTAGVEPDRLIERLFDEMNERLQKEKEKVAQDRTLLVDIGEEVLGPYVSFDKMAMQILGKHWRRITEDQQDRYTAAFKNRVSYAMASQYDPEQKYELTVTDSKFNDRGNRALVKSEVVNKSSSKKYLIDYKLFYSKKNDNWMVYDVIVEGVSMLQSFKTASNEEMSRKGIESLIAQLETESEQDKAKVNGAVGEAMAAQE